MLYDTQVRLTWPSWPSCFFVFFYFVVDVVVFWGGFVFFYTIIMYAITRSPYGIP